MQNIQPNLRDLKCDDLAERLTWVHGDMYVRSVSERIETRLLIQDYIRLSGLPFENDTFDVVKSQYIELCVPECKVWRRGLDPYERF